MLLLVFLAILSCQGIIKQRTSRIMIFNSLKVMNSSNLPSFPFSKGLQNLSNIFEVSYDRSRPENFVIFHRLFGG